MLYSIISFIDISNWSLDKILREEIFAIVDFPCYLVFAAFAGTDFSGLGLANDFVGTDFRIHA